MSSPARRSPGGLRLVELIRPGDTIAWGQLNGEPQALVRALVAVRHQLRDVRCFVGVHASSTVRAEHADALRFVSYSGAGVNADLIDAGALEIIPYPYSAFPSAIGSADLRVDVAFVQVAPAGPDGRYAIGAAAEYMVPAIRSARVVVAQVNALSPHCEGPETLGPEDITVVLHHDEPPATKPVEPARPVVDEVARRVADLIDDGATLQVGLGSLPEAVITHLADRRDLGVHSGLITDGIARLMMGGAVTNRQKATDRGVTVTGVLAGSRLLLDYVHRNPLVELHPTSYTHDPDVLASQHHFVAINSAIEVDLTGQINSEVARGRYVGAVGGAGDFLRGARRSTGGLPIVALPSTAGTRSRVVSRLEGPVSTARADAGLIVTEHGVADLRSADLGARVESMIAIAHPDHRDQLAAAADSLLRPSRPPRTASPPGGKP